MNPSNNLPTVPNQPICQQCNSFHSDPSLNRICSKCFSQTQNMPATFQNHNKQDSCIKTRISKVVFVRQFNGKEQIFEKRCQILQKDTKKCYSCNKKTGLLGTQCKCGFVYCNTHRLPETHSCKFDHNSFAKTKLENYLVKMNTPKVSQF